MTVEEANVLAATLGGKAPGHLIKADDWNQLVGVLQAYGAALAGLPARVAALETKVTQLDAAVTDLQTLPARLQQLEDETAPLRENYLLKVSTTAENTLVGQTAELVFKATKLDGAPLTGPMPWLDVVTTWGRLRAAPGFVVRDNAEENALSIQFNNAGEARVQLRSHFTKGFTPSEENSFGNILKAQVGSTGKTVQKILMDASSPNDPEATQAFQTIHAAYDGNKTVKGYADKYHAQYAGNRFGGIVSPIKLGDWEHYRATVMAFAKPDAAATSPDPTRGVATIQVNFREWIPHWGGHYVDTFTPLLPVWTNLIQLNLTKPDLLQLVVSELDKKAAGDGVLGNLRNLKAIEKVTTQINPGGDSFQQQNKAMLQGAIQLQFAAGGAGTEAAASYAQQAVVTQQIGQQAKSAQATAQDAATAKQAIGVLESRMKAAEQTGKEISAGLKNIGDGVNKINVAEVTDLGGRLNKINLDLVGLANKLNR